MYTIASRVNVRNNHSYPAFDQAELKYYIASTAWIRGFLSSINNLEVLFNTFLFFSRHGHLRANAVCHLSLHLLCSPHRGKDQWGNTTCDRSVREMCWKAWCCMNKCATLLIRSSAPSSSLVDCHYTLLKVNPLNSPGFCDESPGEYL